MSSFVSVAEPDWVHRSQIHVRLSTFCLTGQLMGIVYMSLTEDSAPIVRNLILPQTVLTICV